MLQFCRNSKDYVRCNLIDTTLIDGLFCYRIVNCLILMCHVCFHSVISQLLEHLYSLACFYKGDDQSKFALYCILMNKSFDGCVKWS